jgi:hypothetical protein
MFDRYVALWDLTPDGPPISTPRACLRITAMRSCSNAPRPAVRWSSCHATGGMTRPRGSRAMLSSNCVSCRNAAGADPPLYMVPRPGARGRVPWRSHCARRKGSARSVGRSPRESRPARGHPPRQYPGFRHTRLARHRPQRLAGGERGFDYANLFCNPRSSGSSRRMPISPDRFAARLQNVAQEAGLQRERLLQWILAWTGLSAAWSIGDAESPEIALSVGALAMAELDRGSRARPRSGRKLMLALSAPLTLTPTSSF